MAVPGRVRRRRDARCRRALEPLRRRTAPAARESPLSRGPGEDDEDGAGARPAPRHALRRGPPLVHSVDAVEGAYDGSATARKRSAASATNSWSAMALE